MRIALLALLFLSIAQVCAAQESLHSGAITDIQKEFSLPLNVTAGDLISISPLIRPYSGKQEYAVSILDKEGGEIIGTRGWVGSASYDLDSSKLRFEFSPTASSDALFLVVKGDSPSDLSVALNRTSATDAGSGIDADGGGLEMVKAKVGLSRGHIAGSLERPFVKISHLSDDSDWYSIPAPVVGKKLLISVKPIPRGYLSVNVFSPDGKSLFNQSSVYPFERLSFVLESKGIPDFFIQIGAPNVSGGGFYDLDIGEYDAAEDLNITALAREVMITPLKVIEDDGSLGRFWHVLLIGILGMMAVAMLSAYHFGRRVPDMKSAKDTAEYIRMAIDSGYSEDQIKDTLKNYGYTDAMIRSGFAKAK